MSTSFTLHQLLQRDCIELLDFPLSKLLLMNDNQYPWFVLVPKVEGIKDTYQLDWSEQQQLLNESSMLSEVLMQLFNGDKMNVAALGNVCPQLHIHHIVRFSNDKAWPKPIWGEYPMQPYSDAELAVLKEKLMPALKTVLAQL
ncbi:histidine triad domain protein [Thalassotalea insulae]|uniref:Histidine triad domain protein n=1 Tax=Thalassotalea insulae TaxID=2056778 RepID=A0ABQ6GVB8_9GAMM|nr:HIT family protein [Thalassotalea insulae]GLX79883.1 histidine triad domain protein [Thalassotalea insulae]